jgi:uncharacterized protein
MDYYVYVYIDPRNHEEFYYGKGRGSRKDAHLTSSSDSEKTKRIAAIRKEGLEPIIRVIAANLSNEQALLIEATLLFKLGKSLTNISSGHFVDKFRPHDKIHQELPGFDFQFGVYYFNVGQGDHRQWVDFRKYGFISAGQGPKWARAIRGFNEGDVFAAYLKEYGYVGIGMITQRARPIRDVKINNKPLVSLPLECPNMADNIDSNEKCEYVALVDWIKSVSANDAKWKSGIYTTTHVRASLDGQPKTRAFLEEAFEFKFSDLAR